MLAWVFTVTVPAKLRDNTTGIEYEDTLSMATRIIDMTSSEELGIPCPPQRAEDQAQRMLKEWMRERPLKNDQFSNCTFDVLELQREAAVFDYSMEIQ